MSFGGSIAGIPLNMMMKDYSSAVAQADYFVDITRGVNPTVNTLANSAQLAYMKAYGGTSQPQTGMLANSFIPYNGTTSQVPQQTLLNTASTIPTQPTVVQSQSNSTQQTSPDGSIVDALKAMIAYLNGEVTDVPSNTDSSESVDKQDEDEGDNEGDGRWSHHPHGGPPGLRKFGGAPPRWGHHRGDHDNDHHKRGDHGHTRDGGAQPVIDFTKSKRKGSRGSGCSGKSGGGKPHRKGSGKS